MVIFGLCNLLFKNKNGLLELRLAEYGLKPFDVGSGGNWFLELLYINCMVILKFTSFSAIYWYWIS